MPSSLFLISLIKYINSLTNEGKIVSGKKDEKYNQLHRSN